MAKTVLRIILAIFYFAAGIAHLRSPAGFITITPDWVPFPEFVVLMTGIAEIAGAVGLFIPRFRKAAGVGLALYAVCVWPANFNHALNDIMIGGVDLGWSYHGPRLAFQPVLIWLALWVGEVIDWPFRKRH
ncbi:MAG: DoxX family protein [Sphingorhabdus sp.]|uniref:DoxX family protein n=1 Tax=Sphingorhabdus sp. TaxID=1902408 RepID=UPI0038FC3E43